VSDPGVATPVGSSNAGGVDGPVAETSGGDEDGVMPQKPEVAEVAEVGSTGDAAEVAEVGSTGDAAEVAEVAEVAEGGSTGDAAEPEPDADADAPASPLPMGDYRMALVSSVAVDLPHQHPSVVLREAESPRRQLTFSVGFQDGIALSHALRRIPTPRPLTHELMADILTGFDIDLVAVRLVGRLGSTYFAELDLRGRNGRSVHSCRPTDALTLALRQAVPVPILIDARLFEATGDVAPPA